MSFLTKSVLFLTILGLAACSYPYRPPVIQGAASFAGARDIARQGGENRIQLVFAHGMCSASHKWYGTDTNWVRERLTNVATAIGDTSFTFTELDKVTGGKKFSQGGQTTVRRFDYEMTGADGVNYDIALLTWGERIDAARAQLDYEDTNVSTDPDIPDRASINGGLKAELLDNCVIDAIYYLGSAGNKIRAAMREAVCDYLGGRITGQNTGVAGSSTRCSSPRGITTTPTMLIPESLGSKVLFDAINSLTSGGGGQSVVNALGPVRAIHFATNQIPLLNLAEHQDRAAGRESANGATTLTTLVSRLQPDAGIFESGAPPPPIEIVTYTDPNDPFGYRLQQAHVGPSARLSNVIVSNAGVFAGLVANPIDAHRETARPEIFDMIINGHGP